MNLEGNTLNSTEYVKDALKTESNDFEAIIGRFSDHSTIRGLHASMGMVTEAAELIDVFKKHLFYGKEIDWINIEEEEGDLFWYLAIMVDVMGQENFDRIMAKNNAKLKSRYGNKFTEQAAINRDLSAERSVLEL